MRMTLWTWTVAAMLICGASGCSPPAVIVEHVLPGAMPLPADATAVGAGDFTVRSGPADDFGPFLASCLKKRLVNTPAGPGHAGRSTDAAETRAAVADGQIDIQTADRTGRRSVRTMDPKSHEVKDMDLPTLIRTASVRVEFRIRRTAGGADLGMVELRRSYSSADDPAVRGELGLERADDPARVPPAEQIIRGMLAECAEAFGRMIAPVPVRAQLQMRQANGRYAASGLEAARRRDYADAVRQLQAAVAAAPDDAAPHFDLAIVAEAAGNLDLALEHYQKAWELSTQKDQEAKVGTDRTRRVLMARKP